MSQCDFCHKRRSLLGRYHSRTGEKAIKSSSARNHFATTWADRGVTRDHGRTVRTQLKISTFDMFLVENFRRFLRQVIISLGEGVLSRLSRIVRCLSPFFMPGWRWDEAKIRQPIPAIYRTRLAAA